jgi:hypothetical protein
MKIRRSLPSILAFVLITSPVPGVAQGRNSRVERVLTDGRLEGSRPQNTQTFVRTDLFFGTAKPDGVVSDEDFQLFLDEVVTPLFPDGLTVVKGEGQFRGENGITIKETSFLLIVLYPLDQEGSGDKKVEQIRAEYKRRHRQESVLRMDRSLVRVSGAERRNRRPTY